MVTQYKTTDVELKKVADAIRAKGATTAPLTYPDGFKTAIENIPTGGGGSTLPKCWVDLVTTRQTNLIRAEDWSDIVTKEFLLAFKKVNKIIYKGELADYMFTYLGMTTTIYTGTASEVDLTGYKFDWEKNELFSHAFLKGLPKGLDIYGKRCFYYVRFESDNGEFVIPEGVTKIGNECFYSAKWIQFGTEKDLVKITVPTTVTRYGDYNAISGGYSEGVILEFKNPTPVSIYSNTFSNIKQIIVPVGTLDAYKTATNWSKWADKMVEATA